MIRFLSAQLSSDDSLSPEEDVTQAQSVQASPAHSAVSLSVLLGTSNRQHVRADSPIIGTCDQSLNMTNDDLVTVTTPVVSDLC